MRLKPVTFLISSILVLVSSFASAEKLVVGADSWEPFRFIGKDSVTGIDNELLKKLSSHIDIEVEYLKCPWKRCLKMMESGQLDAMTGLAWRKERAEYITYTEPHYYSCTTQLYVKKGYKHKIQKHQDLHNLTVGIVGGSAYYEAFDKDILINKMSMAQESILPDLLLKNRIDSFIGTDCQVDYELAESGLSDQIEKSDFNPGNEVKLYLGLSSKSKWVSRLSDLNKALSRVRDDNFEENAIEIFRSSKQ